MPITERSARRLILQAGRTCLLLDKASGKATLQRKLLFWKLRPVEVRLSDICHLTIDAVPDRALGGRTYYITLDLRNGAGWLLRATDKDDADFIAAALRIFLGAAPLNSRLIDGQEVLEGTQAYPLLRSDNQITQQRSNHAHLTVREELVVFV